MKDIVYVSGHRNPDTDSICSALSYAYLLNKTGKYNAVPCRLGDVSRETEFVIKRFKMQAPTLLKSVKQKVEDLNYDKVTVFSKELTLKTAWFLLKEQGLKSAPVLDENGMMLGLLSVSNIIQGFMDDWDSNVLKLAKTPIENVVDTLEANVIYLDRDYLTIQGEVHIAAMQTEEAQKRINPGDIVIVGGDRHDAIESLIKSKPALIILTGALGIDQDQINRLKENKISLISTTYNTYKASQQIVQAIPVEYVMQKANIYTFSTDDTLDRVKEIMSETRYRAYPVMDLNGRCVGSLSRFALLQGLRKQVILVDHNERGQSIPGIEEADILEIIDHHRVADIQTIGPLMFRSEPLGCTCTILTKMYEEQGVDIPREIAGIMLSAILSDTLIFKSPTCTPTDILKAKKLAQIAGVNIEEYGMEMFKAGTSLVGKTVEEIFNQDMKFFSFKTDRISVAQVNTMDIEGFMPLKENMLEYMEDFVKENNLKFAVLLLTDVINANSEIFVAGSRQDLVGQAFNIHLNNQQGTLNGVISRKKQVVPALTRVMVA